MMTMLSLAAKLTGDLACMTPGLLASLLGFTHPCVAVRTIGPVPVFWIANEERPECRASEAMLTPAERERYDYLASPALRMEYLQSRWLYRLLEEARLAERLKPTSVLGRLIKVATGTGGRTELVKDKDGVPVWRKGVVGSVTHSGGTVAISMMDATHVAGIGIDFEVIEPDMAEQERVILDTSESALLRRILGAAPTARDIAAVFSAKESFYKAVFPTARVRLGFHDARVTQFDPASGTMTLVLTKSVGPYPKGKEFSANVEYLEIAAKPVVTSSVLIVKR